jgi:hypothetical protein
MGHTTSRLLSFAIVGLYHHQYMVQIENDVYAQIGFVMLIGLSAKNSILIVAFAKEDYERGMSLVDAALTVARLRFRPLMMTAFAFILGSCRDRWMHQPNPPKTSVCIVTADGLFRPAGCYSHLLGL